MKLFKKKSENGNGGESQDSGADESGGGGGTTLTTKRIIVGILCTVVLLWVVGVIIGFFEPSTSTYLAKNEYIANAPESSHGQPTGHETLAGEPSAAHAPSEGLESHTATGETHGTAPGALATSHGAESMTSPGTHAAPETSSHLGAANPHGSDAPAAVSDKTSPTHGSATTAVDAQGNSAHAPAAHVAAETGHGETTHEPAPAAHGTEAESTHAPAAPAVHRRTGVAFVEAMIEPLRHELEDRWWGWRPNDIINLTDNVNNYQLGILEVTRRASVSLAERLSRTGSTASFDENLERSMNWFVVKADSYWFPSPESKYKEGIEELVAFKEKLERGEANFFTRPDSLIPLLMSIEDLLGSCDENLAKVTEDDGTPVSFFKADDYFYYAKGVATALLSILEAVHEDFHTTLETRRGTEILHHAVESCHHATTIEPWLILESDLDSIFANHRANMAAPISHARFYIGLLIKALST